MNITDIIALAKQGYKPADIERLMAIEPPAAPDPEPEAQPEPQPEAQPEPQPEASVDDETQDFEDLYNQQKAEIDRLKKALENSQKANKKQDIGGEGPADIDVLSDYVKSFM